MGEEEGGMKPIPIIGRVDEEPEFTADEFLRFQKQRHEQRVQWVFLTIIGVMVLGLFVPLVLWLSRLALGG